MVDISVIIPVYNVEKYLSQCIESVLNQSKSNIEIICINDGSTDRSFEILEEYQKNDKRISIINTPNRGLSLARNEGINAAQGKYVYFVDSDDWIIPKALELMFDAAEENSLEILYVGIFPFADDEDYVEMAKNRELSYQINGTYEAVLSGKGLLCEMEKNDDFRVVAYSSFFLLSFINEKHLSFYPGILHEDNLFTYQAFIYASRAGVLKENVYRRRFRKDSIVTRERNFDSFYGNFISFVKMKQFAFSNKLYEEKDNLVLLHIFRINRVCLDYYTSLSLEEREKVSKLTMQEHYYFYTELLAGIQVIDQWKRNLKNTENKSSTLEQQNKRFEAELDTLKQQKKQLEVKVSSLEQQKQQLEVRVGLLEQQKKQLEEKLVRLTGEIENIIHSSTFRVGKILLYVPIKMKNIVKEFFQ